MVVLVAGVATLILQGYVGDKTIYAPELAARRDSIHSFILHNQLPPGRTWEDYGANGSQARVLTVYTAEAVHRSVGVPVQKVYFWLDTLALFISLILLYGFLRSWGSPERALTGVLIAILVLPLTYALHFFHPWDRLSLLIWIGLLSLLRAERLVAFGALLVVGMLVKYDLIFLPGLYFLIHLGSNNRRVLLTTAALFLVSIGTYLGIVFAFGSGTGERSIGIQVAHNLAQMKEMSIWYPPLLGFAIPGGLALLGWSRGDRFARASAGFALLFCIPLFLLTNFAEIRAQMPVVVLLLPLALAGLDGLLTTRPTGDNGGSSP